MDTTNILGITNPNQIKASKFLENTHLRDKLETMEVQNLAAIMKAGNLTAQDIAQAFGYTQWQIYNIKQGKTPMPADLVVKLAELVKASPTEFKTKDLTKQIKSMVIVINRLPEEEKPEIVEQLRKELAECLTENRELQKMIIRLQAQLLQQK